MERSVRSVLVFVAVSLLICCQPTDAWYKQSTGPSYYSVGRASGLLSGIRRSPYVRRSETDPTLDSGETTGVSNSVMPDSSSRQTSVLKNMVNAGFWVVYFKNNCNKHMLSICNVLISAQQIYA